MTGHVVALCLAVIALCLSVLALIVALWGKRQ
jgi:hypothetical protein